MNQNVLKFCRNFFVDFRVQASFGAFWATSMKILTWAYFHVVYFPWKFQFRILNRFGLKFRTTRPSKFDKIDDSSRPEVTSSKQKNVYQIFMINYQSWKFHQNRSNRFREIFCTKSVRKIIRIRTRHELVASNEEVFRPIGP